MSWSFTLYGRSRAKLAAKAESLLSRSISYWGTAERPVVEERIAGVAAAVRGLLGIHGGDYAADSPLVFKLSTFGHVDTSAGPSGSSIEVKLECCSSIPLVDDDPMFVPAAMGG